VFDLLIDVRPRTDESLLGYLHRLADANGLEGRVLQKEAKSATCAQYLAMVHGNGAHPSWLPVHKELAGRPLQTTRLWNLRLPRYCPACLAESLHWRARWDISLMTACGRHKLRLLDCCQNCGKHLSWDRHNASYCLSCAHPLTIRAGIEKHVAYEELWFVRELEQRLMRQSRMLDLPLKHIDLDRFHEIAFRLGAGVMRQLGRMPRKVRLARSMDVAQPIALSAGRIFSRWPKGLFDVLEKIRGCSAEMATGGPTAIFGILHQEFSSLYKDDVLFIREVFDSYLKGRWPHCARRLTCSAEVLSASDLYISAQLTP